MATRAPMQCMVCIRFRSPLDSPLDDAPEQTCDAFPERIPDTIWTMQSDHRQPFPGDHGLRWVSDGSPYPADFLQVGGDQG